MVSALKRLVPRGMRRQYHHVLALLASHVYGRPSRELVVIGVTGTDGKTTTASLIADVLSASGAKVGISSSAIFQIGDRRWLNETHMTMPGRFGLQKMLRDMVQAGCQYAVIEVSSEGLVQYRHAGIDFDIAVITNLSPEHIEAHGSFENYRLAKGILFNSIIRGGDKHIDGKKVPKATVVNLDDPSHDFFLKFWAEKHYGFGLQPHQHEDAGRLDKLITLIPTAAQTTDTGSTFTLEGQTFRLPLPGKYNVYNALAATAVARAVDVEWPVIAEGLSNVQAIPGRGETIDSGKGWKVVVDYALTPHALEALYTSLQSSGAQGIIGVFGAAGGGRDVWKRPELGKTANEYCTKIILTTDDPYNENPENIAQDILKGVSDKDKAEIILDRREAIKKAITMAQAGDVIAVTGMGSETSMMVKGVKVEWSDVGVVKKLLAGSL